MNKQQFGRHIRGLRKKRGISLRSLATFLEVSPAFVSHLERGLTSMPTPARIRAIANALGVESEALLIASGRVPEDLGRLLRNRTELRVLLRTASLLDEAAIAQLIQLACKLKGM